MTTLRDAAQRLVDAMRLCRDCRRPATYEHLEDGDYWYCDTHAVHTHSGLQALPYAPALRALIAALAEPDDTRELLREARGFVYQYGLHDTGPGQDLLARIDAALGKEPGT